MGRGENILTLLVEGEPATAFPPPLIADPADHGQSVSSPEPLAADVRPQEGETDRHRRQNATLKLIAAILGVKFEELRQREQERALRRSVQLVSVATATAIVFALISVIAWVQRQHAIGRLGDSLLAQADSQRLLYRSRADSLYAEAYDAYASINADTSMVELEFNERLLFSPPPLAILAGHTGAVSRVQFAGDARSLVSAGADGTLRRWDLATQTESASINLGQGAIVDASLLPDAERLVYAAANGTVGIADLENGRVARILATGRTKLRRVAASPDGHFVAWGGEDGLLEIADLNEERVNKLDSPAEAITGLCFYPDGRLLISSSSQHAIRIWSAVDGRLLRTLGYGTMDFADVALFGDGRGLLTGRSGLDLGAFVWDLTDASFVPILTLDTHGAANPGNESIRVVQTRAVAISPESHFTSKLPGRQGEVAFGGEGGHIVLWDLYYDKDPSSVLIAHDGSVNSLAFSPDGQYFASSGSDGLILVWNRKAFSRVADAVTGEDDFIRSTAISSDGSLVAAAGDKGVVRVWDVATRQLLRSLSSGKTITKVAFSPDDQEIIFNQVHEPILKAWRFADGSMAQFQDHSGDVMDFAFVPRLGYLASANGDQSLRLWDPSTHKVVRTFQLDYKVRAIGPLRRRSAVAIATDTGDVVLYDLDHGRKLWSVHPAGKGIRSIAVVNNDKLVASGSEDGTIRIWDSSDGRERFTLHGHEDWVTALAGYGARWLISSSWDSNLRVWDLESGSLVRSISRGNMFGYYLAVSADGQFLASANNRYVNLWPLRAERRWLHYRALLGDGVKALSRSKQDVGALTMLGEWYAQRGDGRLAAEMLERASKAGGNVPALKLARLYWISGRTEDARRSYDRALQAGEITRSYHDLCVSALSASATPTDKDSPPPPRLWASLWEFARRSRTSDGSEPGAPLEKDLAAWADSHPQSDLTQRLRTAQQLFDLHSDPLQAMAPLGAVMLPQVLTDTLTSGQLFRGGPTQSDGHLFQMTTIEVDKAAGLEIEMSSKEFAPRLIVAEIRHGKPIEASGQVGTSATIRLTPESGSELLIMCTSIQRGKVGSFDLRIGTTVPLLHSQALEKAK
jgi:WD40 repeat protein